MTSFPSLHLASLYSGEEARAGVAVELYALNVNVSIRGRAPEFEEDIFPRAEADFVSKYTWNGAGSNKETHTAG